MNIKDSVGKYLSYSEGDYYDDADSMDYDYDEAQDEQYEEAAPEKPARASKKNFFDSMNKRINEYVYSRTNFDTKMKNKLKKDDVYMNEEDALKYGVIDKIIEDFEEIF